MVGSTQYSRSLLDPDKVYDSWYHIRLAEEQALLVKAMEYAKDHNEYDQWAHFIRTREANITYYLARIEQKERQDV